MNRSDPKSSGGDRSRRLFEADGFTLVELVIVVAIVGILAAVVLPLAHWSVKRQDEYELQRNLRVLRNAIDRYHDLALAGMIEGGPDDTGYPPDLDVLVEGVELVGELPSLVPGVSDEYSASGVGLTGGYSGATEQQDGSAWPPTALAAAGGGVATDDPAAAAVRDALLGGAVSSTMQEVRGLLGQRAGTGPTADPFGAQGRGRQGLGRERLGGLGGFADRGRAGRGRRAAGAEVQKIVLLRRLPVDPMTGEADWGLRCYGDSIDDRSWCGRNVFDVYSKARARGIDGRPYREW